MKGTRFATALLVLVVVAQSTTGTYMSERRLRGSAAKLQSLEKAIITRWIENELAQMQPASSTIKNGVKQIANQFRSSYLRTGKLMPNVVRSRQNILAGRAPILRDTDDGGLPKPEQALQTTIWNLLGHRGGRTFSFEQPEQNHHVDFIRDMVKSTGPSSTEHSERYLTALQNAVANLRVWINKTPCPECAEWLINKYENVPHDEKPEFMVADFFTYSDKGEHINQALECLAKMIKEGFKLTVWNMNKYKLMIEDESVIDFLNRVENLDGYDTAVTGLQQILDKAHNMQAKTPASTVAKWCIKK